MCHTQYIYCVIYQDLNINLCEGNIAFGKTRLCTKDVWLITVLWYHLQWNEEWSACCDTKHTVPLEMCCMLFIIYHVIYNSVFFKPTHVWFTLDLQWKLYKRSVWVAKSGLLKQRAVLCCKYIVVLVKYCDKQWWSPKTGWSFIKGLIMHLSLS